jgi:hypothetical protein
MNGVIIAAIIVLLLLAVYWHSCPENMANHYRASATSRPIPAITRKEDAEILAILQRNGLKREGNDWVGPPEILRLVRDFENYIRARFAVNGRKSQLLAIEKTLDELKAASQNNYTADIADKTAAAKSQWQQKQKELSLEIGKYNAAAAKLNIVQRKTGVILIRF